MKFSARKKETSTILVPVVTEVDGVDVEGHFPVTYFPSAFTPKMEQQLRAVSRAAKRASELSEGDADNSDIQAELGGEPASVIVATVLSKLLHSWGLEDDDDNEIPTNVETLVEMDIEFLVDVFMKISGAVRPKKTTPATSPAG